MAGGFDRRKGVRPDRSDDEARDDEHVADNRELWAKIAAHQLRQDAAAAATAAIDRKGAGDPVDAQLAARVAGQTGVDVSGARVHADPVARGASAALNARAFAHGQDVFLGPGERADDPHLMAHELTHVAQQTGGVQRKVAIGAANSPAEVHADRVAAQVTAGAAPAHLLVDGGPLAPGQQHKQDFLATLRSAVENAIDRELGRRGATTECPYLDLYFARYANEPAASAESVLRKWLPGAKAAHAAVDLIPLVLDRVRAGTRSWVQTGRLPDDVVALDPGVAQLQHAPPGSLQRMETELGPGQPLDGNTAARMSSALGADVSGARIHRGATAERIAVEHDALALTVGQNIVMGAQAPTTGIQADALLAHELVHTLQQKDAATDAEARMKPIAAEDAAAEHDAGLARLSNFAGALGDVMRTGVQLQRCPGNKLPAGPPMSGKDADVAIANTAEVANYIHNDVMSGITGEKRVHLHDDFEEYVKAFHDDSAAIQTFHPEGLADDALEKEKWKLARKMAEEAPGFTNPFTHVVHLYTKGTPRFVTIHEMMHAYTAQGAYQLGGAFVEGSADYFTRIICEKNKIPFYETYRDQYTAVAELAAILGDHDMARLTFHGEVEVARVVVDSKAPGTWKAWLRAMSGESPDYKLASRTLRGVKEANDKRLEADAVAEHNREEEEKRAAQAEREKDRATWPAEAKTALHGGHIVVRRIIGGKTQVGVGIGGARGVREGWTAHMKLKEGGTLDAPVVDVVHGLSYFELSSPDVAEKIDGDVELRPKAR